MKSKEEVIRALCLDYRHDYGLRKEPNDPPWTSGMTDKDAESLYKVMEELYNTVLEPNMKAKNVPK